MHTTPLLLSDHAVWQRDRPIALTGEAPPGTRVTARFRERGYDTVADAHGRWRLALGPLAPTPASRDTGDDLVLAVGDTTSTTRDILVGDVWLCSGQSNMEMPLKDCDGGIDEANHSHHARLRLLTVRRTVADAPLAPHELPTDGWQRCTPESAGAFSAVGFWFGRRVLETTRVPIGLVQAAVGNTPCESWTSREVLESDRQFAPILERWKQSLRDWPDAEKRYERAFAKWDHDADLAEREGRAIPGAFPKLIGPGATWTPAGLFNAMIAPLTTTPIKGVTWYQGAASPDRAFQYRALFRALIRQWRASWNLGYFPFLFVQEAAFGPRRDEPCEHSWAELREAQAMALTEPNTAMAVAIDTGDAADIHPRKKEPLGDRLALAARARVYGENIAWSGPVLRSWRVEGSRVRLTFDHTFGGLRTSDVGPLVGFAVSAGATDFTQGHRNFAWADARIEGDDVIVQSARVASPVAVRYAWAQNPRCNLVNAAGLPAAPFRSDDWPGVTVSNF